MSGRTAGPRARGADCAGALRGLARALAETGLPPRPEALGLSARELAGCLEQAAAALQAQAASHQGTLDLSPPAARPDPAGETAPAPAPDSLHILHADGGSRGNPGPAGAGAAILDSTGKPLALLKSYLGETTNNVAEYQGLILGLEAALARGIKRLEVRLDSELLVRQLQGRYKVKAPHLLPLYQEAKALLARFAVARLTHIPRAQNALADQLANEAMDSRVPPGGVPPRP